MTPPPARSTSASASPRAIPARALPFLLVAAIAALAFAPVSFGPTALEPSAALAQAQTVAPPAAEPDLTTFTTKFYTIHTNLNREETIPFGRHMDAVYAEYQKRFAGFRAGTPGAMSLYLFRTQEQYEAFLMRHKINGANTGGMFFVQSRLQGLATFVQGKSISATFSVLQHEGFHQFAFHHIGPDLPNWVNEGIAQYFEDSVLVGDQMYQGLANARRVAAVKASIASHSTIPFDKLLPMSQDQWHKAVVAGSDEAAQLYDQSWSMVYFLIHAEEGRYRAAFENYLQLVSKGKDGGTAFKEAFGAPDTAGFRQRWEEYARTIEPDPVNVALERMEFLGEAMRFLKKRGEAVPTTMDALRFRLKAIRFQAVKRDQHGLTTKASGTEESLYRYNRSDGVEATFKMLPADGKDLLPRITAPGLRPEPTLVWWRDSQNQLMQDLSFR
ncbi:MAG: DUF1570 domain-containing protein [Planctomycetota bacterium]|nr:DUF1570 domain-containing protein [Planctomycetota bacterium]